MVKANHSFPFAKSFVKNKNVFLLEERCFLSKANPYPTKYYLFERNQKMFGKIIY